MEEFRYFLKLAYNGTPYHGWQSQKNAHSVQQEIEHALSCISGNRPIQITGAGRTDTGVHARCYYAHFDIDKHFERGELEQLVYRLNHILPDSIAVYDAFPVKPDAHARFSAISRTYRYYICRNHDPFSTGFSWRLTIPLNLDDMNEAASIIKDHSDFTCFAKTGTQTKTNICEVTESKWFIDDNFLVYETTANRFLRNMVRAMVGTLVDVGKGRTLIDDFRRILLEGTRSDAGQSVPACGLFLEDITYPEIRQVEAQITALIK